MLTQLQITSDYFSICTLNINSLSKSLDTFFNSICIDNEYKFYLISFVKQNLPMILKTCMKSQVTKRSL